MRRVARRRSVFVARDMLILWRSIWWKPREPGGGAAIENPPGGPFGRLEMARGRVKASDAAPAGVAITGTISRTRTV
jgi:hypothetical protein